MSLMFTQHEPSIQTDSRVSITEVRNTRKNRESKNTLIDSSLQQRKSLNVARSISNRRDKSKRIFANQSLKHRNMSTEGIIEKPKIQEVETEFCIMADSYEASKVRKGEKIPRSVKLDMKEWRERFCFDCPPNVAGMPPPLKKVQD